MLFLVCEKYLRRNDEGFDGRVGWTEPSHIIRDLDTAYNMIDRHGLWQRLRVYRVGGKLLKAVQSFNDFKN